VRRLVPILLIVLSPACAAPAAETPPAVTVDFRGLWFSDAEAARMRSGEAHVRPSQDVSIASWNAITPESPHPDIVNARIRIAVPDDARRKASVVALREEWQIGEPESQATAEWSEHARRSYSPIDLVPGNTVNVSLPMAVGDMVRRQSKEGRTTYRLAVRVELRETPQAPVLATAQATLPIVIAP
jgi:hypothetical protein